MQTIGYAAHSSETPLAPFHFDRREPRPNDVVIEILFCGVCHTDLHAARNDWGSAQYPVVPGHEIVGRVVAVGPAVTMHRVGDNVAVGCMVDSCMSCDRCEAHQEQHCRTGMTGTYGGRDRIDGTPNYGGYSRHIVVREEFVLRVPTGLDLARTAPILCAGITTWSPLRRFNVGPGSRVGVLGLGGLGHMAVKLAVALGAHVTVLSRTADKREEALAMGAHALLVSSDAEAMAAAARSLDLIVDTVPVRHDINPYVDLLDYDGMLAVVGQLGPVGELNARVPVLRNAGVVGSLIGGIAETQALLDFCAEHGVLADCEMIAMDQINEAYVRLDQGDVHYRFVIDMATLAA